MRAQLASERLAAETVKQERDTVRTELEQLQALHGGCASLAALEAELESVRSQLAQAQSSHESAMAKLPAGLATARAQLTKSQTDHSADLIQFGQAHKELLRTRAELERIQQPMTASETDLQAFHSQLAEQTTLLATRAPGWTTFVSARPNMNYCW
jgi:DNA repair exonuclease SbcCD ATPase subunit